MIKATIQAVSFDKEGRVVRVWPEKETNSLVFAFVKTFCPQFGGPSIQTLNTSGTLVTLVATNDFFRANESNSSIRIGSGTDPVTMDDYKLQSEITTGISFGTVYVSHVVIDTTSICQITRTFTESTGTPRTINEVGLYARNSTNIILVERTLYSATLPANGSLTLTYKIYTIL